MPGEKKQKLKDGKVLKRNELTKTEEEAIESLSDDEIGALISSYEKLEAAAPGSPTRIINF